MKKLKKSANSVMFAASRLKIVASNGHQEPSQPSTNKKASKEARVAQNPEFFKINEDKSYSCPTNTTHMIDEDDQRDSILRHEEGGPIKLKSTTMTEDDFS